MRHWTHSLMWVAGKVTGGTVLTLTCVINTRHMRCAINASSQHLHGLTRIQLQRLTRLVPEKKSFLFLFLFLSGCRQLTEFFSKTRKSASPSTLASASAPTPQSCAVSQGWALASSVIDEHNIRTVSKLLLIWRWRLIPPLPSHISWTFTSVILT